MQPRDGRLRLRGRRVRRQQAAREGEQRGHRRGHRRILGHHRRRARARTPVSSRSVGRMYSTCSPRKGRLGCVNVNTLSMVYLGHLTTNDTIWKN